MLVLQIYDAEQAEVDSLTQQIATHSEQAMQHQRQADELAKKLAKAKEVLQVQFQHRMN